MNLLDVAIAGETNKNIKLLKLYVDRIVVFHKEHLWAKERGSEWKQTER